MVSRISRVLKLLNVMGTCRREMAANEYRSSFVIRHVGSGRLMMSARLAPHRAHSRCLSTTSSVGQMLRTSTTAPAAMTARASVSAATFAPSVAGTLHFGVTHKIRNGGDPSGAVIERASSRNPTCDRATATPGCVDEPNQSRVFSNEPNGRIEITKEANRSGDFCPDQR
jgi:hypothetical protein